MQQLPEYLRDVLRDQQEEEDLLVPKVRSWGIDDCLFTDEEIAEQERSIETLQGDPYSMYHWAEEYDKQERTGTNSWLDAQPYGPGVSNPQQDSAIRTIKKYGYAGTVRTKRPSLIYKSILTELSHGLPYDEQVRLLRRILSNLNLDPTLFVEQKYHYKYPEDKI